MAVKIECLWIIDGQGQRYMDASEGAVVVTLWHTAGAEIAYATHRPDQGLSLSPFHHVKPRPGRGAGRQAGRPAPHG
jgi:acetylornithine/succinyldiaminopimelate/putrescine aminotransferase